MKNLCLFASYFTGTDIPYYVRVYLKELKKHFAEVVLLSSQKNISEASLKFLESEKIDFLALDNKGFDFGLWYHAFQKYDVDTYDQIALVNDSTILFKPLDEFMNWTKQNTADLKGITASESVSPHIQSYFLLLNKKAIGLLKEYFNVNKVLNDIHQVIKVYEIGFSRFLVSKEGTMAAFVDNDGYIGEFSPYYQCVNYHISKGIPVIKKKILFSSYRKEELFTLARMNFNISVEVYIEAIKRKNPNLILDFEELKKDNHLKFSFFAKLKYNTTRKLIGVFRPFRKLVGLVPRVSAKVRSMADSGVGKVYLFSERTGLVKKINFDFDKQVENAVKIDHSYPKNFDKKDAALFAHYTGYQSANEEILQLNHVNVSHVGVVFKGLSNLGLALPHTVFRAKFGWPYIIGQYINHKRIIGSSVKNYVLVYDFWSAANYYHWLIDTLPRLLIIKEELKRKDHVLLLPANPPAFVMATLAYFEIDSFINIEKGEYFTVDNLKVPYYLAGSGHIHPKKVVELKEFFTKRIQSNSKFERIYVSRGRQKARKVANEREVVNVLRALGFETIYFEDHTFEQQVQLMMNAKVVVSSHGANLTNTLFMPDGAKVLELIRSDKPNFCYWALASVAKLDYHYQLCNVEKGDNLRVNIELLKSNMNSILKS